MTTKATTIDGNAVLVTGANRGLGQALVNEALRRGAARVYAGTRQPLSHTDERVTPLALDVTDDRAPIGAMQGLAPTRVIYAGTASKTLAPGLRLGWLVAPVDLVEGIAEAKSLADRGSPVLDQLAFADFVARGEFDRHLRRMRPLYRRRRDILLENLREHVPDLEPAGIAAGLHLVAYLPSHLDEAAVINAAARRGLAAYGLAPYRIAHAGRSGLVFGYATLAEHTIVEGVEMLAAAIADVRT